MENPNNLNSSPSTPSTSARPQDKGRRSKTDGRNRGKGRGKGNRKDNNQSGNNNGKNKKKDDNDNVKGKNQNKENKRFQWESIKIDNEYSAKKTISRLLEIEPLRLLDILSTCEGSERIKEICGMTIVQEAQQRNELSLHDTILPFFMALTKDDVVNTPLKYDLKNIYESLFKNPRLFISVLKNLKICVDKQNFKGLKSSQDEASAIPPVNSWDELLRPVLKLLYTYMMLKGTSFDELCIDWVTELEKICDDVYKFHQLDIETIELKEKLNRKIIVRSIAIPKYDEYIKKNEPKEKNQFEAYKAPDGASIIADEFEEFLNLVPSNENILSLGQNDSLPKRYNKTFTAAANVKNYFFRLMKDDALAQFSCIDSLFKDHELFSLDGNGNLKKSNYLQFPMKGHVDSNFVNVSLYGPGKIINVKTFDRESKMGFLCEAKHPKNALRGANSKKSMERFWESKSSSFQPGSIIILLWKFHGEKAKAMLVKVIGCSDPKNFHPCIILDRDNHQMFQFYIIPYNDSDMAILLKIFIYKDVLINFASVKGHFFIASEAILKSIADQNFLSNGLRIEDAILGDRRSRVENPNSNRSIPFNFNCLFNNNKQDVMIDIGNITAKHLFQQLEPYANNNELFLDTTQTRGIAAALTQRISLIQGPPGTGKTYLGIHITRLLIKNKIFFDDGPILCICYTNHALDSFLEGLIKAGIDRKSIIRGGNSSKREDFKDLTLSERSKFFRNKHENYLYSMKKKVVENIGEELIKIITEYKNFKNQEKKIPRFDTVHDILTRYKLEGHLKSLSGIDEDGFRGARKKKPEESWRQWASDIKNNFDDSNEFPDSIRRDKDLKNYDYSKKRIFVSVLHNLIKQDAEKSFELIPKIHKKYQEECGRLEAINRNSDLSALKSASIIGFTTSGAAKYGNLLQVLGAKTIICEEAGEVIEPHILASLSRETKRLILIGDHLQLRPKVNLYYLEAGSGKGHDLDISLFERLIGEEETNQMMNKDNDGFGVTSLHIQRRMRPEISSLFRDSKLYPYLADGESVKKYPNVRGMKENLYFFDHQHPESGGSNSAEGLSYSNDWEADMVISIVGHLIRNGYSGNDQIAVLTPYIGQVKILRDKLKETDVNVEIDEITKVDLAAVDENNSELDDNNAEEKKISKVFVSKSMRSCVRLSSIDNFQGEEADVVVISTVRSNQEGKAGFLKVMNRANVMLSRAKHGMYILGDATLIEKVQKKAEKNSFFLFGEFLMILKSRGLVGDSIPLRCEKHPDTPINAKTKQDILAHSPEGGCSQKCEGRLSCGHPCQLLCHPKSCRDNECAEICNRPRTKCNHPCKNPCGLQCGECEEKVSRVIPKCGHDINNIECHYATLNDEEFQRLFESKKLKCFQEVECFYTTANKPIWACDHKWKSKCWEAQKIQDYASCNQICIGNIDGCDHPCSNKCKDCSNYRKENPEKLHAPCKMKCEKQLLCGHNCESICHFGKNCPPCDKKCESKCSHSKCLKLCSDYCSPCTMECEWICTCKNNFKCTAPCGAPCNRLPCNNRCTKNLPCGHQCPSLCGEICPTKQDYCQECIKEEKVNSMYSNFVVEFILFGELSSHDLSKDPLIILECGHPFAISTLDKIFEVDDLYEFSNDEEGNKNWVNLKPIPFDFSSFKLPSCSICRTPAKARRYGRIINAIRLYLSALEHNNRIRKEIGSIDKEFQNSIENEKDIFFNEFKSPKEAFNKAVKNQIVSLKKIEQKIDFLRNPKNNPITKMNDAIISFRKRKKSDTENFPYNLDRSTEVRLLQAHSKLSILQAQQTLLNMIKEVAKGNKKQNKKHSTNENFASSANLIEYDKYKISKIGDVAKLIQEGENDLDKALIICNGSELKRSLIQTMLLYADYELSCLITVLFYENVHLNFLKLPKYVDDVFTSPDIYRKKVRILIEPIKNEIEIKYSSDKEIQSQLEKIELKTNFLFNTASKEEMIEIFNLLSKEVGFGNGGFGGHWFQCPNGHIYAIGECGGAMQQSHCIECGATIGGGNHQLASGNRRADEFLAEVS